MSYLSEHGKMSCEDIPIRSAISTGLRDEQTYDVDHLFKNRHNWIPLLLTCIGTALLLATFIYQVIRCL